MAQEEEEEQIKVEEDVNLQEVRVGEEIEDKEVD